MIYTCFSHSSNHSASPRALLMGQCHPWRDHSHEDRNVPSLDKSDESEELCIDSQRQHSVREQVVSNHTSKVNAPSQHNRATGVHPRSTEIQFSLNTWHVLLQLQAKAQEDWGKIQSWTRPYWHPALENWVPCHNENNARLEGCFAKSHACAQPHVALITAPLQPLSARWLSL